MPDFKPTLEQLEARDVPSTVVSNFSNGLWRWDTTDGWSHLTTLSASNCSVDDQGNVFAKFSDGLWRWSDATYSWQKLSNLTVQFMDVSAGGALYGDFGTNGVWRWGFSGWVKMSMHDVVQFAVSDADVFYGSFNTGGQGTWRWTPAAGWSLLSGARPDEMEADDAGNLVAFFNANNITLNQRGTWRWTPTTNWRYLSSNISEGIYVSDNGTIFEDRGSNPYGSSGLWMSVNGGEFQKILNFDITLGRALPNGSFLFDYGSTSYHYISGQSYTSISSTSAYANRGVGMNSEVFYDYGSGGLKMWTRAGGFVTLSGQNPQGCWSQDQF